MIDFEFWIKTAQPWQRFSYYRGMSLTDTLISNQVRQIVWFYACRGDCYLFQKKHAKHDYEFIAVKAQQPHNRALVPLPEPRNTRAGQHFRTYPSKLKPEHLEVSTHG